MRIAQLGHGRWGAKLRRAFESVDGVELVLVCDPVAAARDRSPVATAASEQVAFARDDIDAIVIATPPELHHEHARAALSAGKHVFVEKPLALAVDDARELVTLAARDGRTLMVGHVVLFDEAVQWIKRFLDAGGLGEVQRASFRRTGSLRADRTVGALWNLAPHDVSLADYWFGAPSDVEAFGWTSRPDGLDEESLLRLRYARGLAIDIRVGWLDSEGARRAVLVGSDSTVVYETAPETRLTVYRAGTAQVVELAPREPLQAEVEHFVESIRVGRVPLSDGESGLRVVSTLAAARRSLSFEPLAS
jgi:predicted dehydrogenase